MQNLLDFLKLKLGRTGLPIGIALVVFLAALFIGISSTNVEVVLFKFLIFCPAVALVHAIRRTLFPYVDMSVDYEESIDRLPSAVLFGTMILFYCWMTSILVSAI